MYFVDFAFPVILLNPWFELFSWVVYNELTTQYENSPSLSSFTVLLMEKKTYETMKRWINWAIFLNPKP